MATDGLIGMNPIDATDLRALVVLTAQCPAKNISGSNDPMVVNRIGDDHRPYVSERMEVLGSIGLVHPHHTRCHATSAAAVQRCGCGL